MLAIGRGLMAEPKLLILDEPSLGLSPLLVEELFALIKRINHEGIALLLVEQNVVQSLEVAQRAYVLDNGQFVLQGNAAAIRNDPNLTPSLSRTVTMADRDSLRTLLARKPIVVAPGVYDAFTALVASQAGFSTLYVSGAAIAYTRLGRPDIGLVSMSEVAETISLIRDRVDAHLIVDADTGYGNALNVERTVRTFERAGATAIQTRGSGLPQALRPSRRQGADAGDGDVRQDQGGARYPAFTRDADHRAHRRGGGRRASSAPSIARWLIARPAPTCCSSRRRKARDDLARIVSTLGTAVPLMANMVEGGKTPPLSAAELEAIGFALVIFPGGIVRALAKTMQDYYASLAAHGTTEPFRDRMLDFQKLNELIGTPEMIALGQRYETPPPPATNVTGRPR